MYVCCSATDIVLDVAILCLPALFIRNLQVSRSKKIWIGGIFGLGVLSVPFALVIICLPLTFASSCVVASIARLAYAVIFVVAHRNNDFAVDDSR